MPRFGELQQPITVTQTDPDDLHVQIGHDNDSPYFATLPHGTNTSVWSPASGSRIHMKSIIVSVESAGLVSLFRDATEWCRMHFNEKKTVPLGFASDITLDVDEELKATYTADSGSTDAFITVLGHEHE